jgi:polyisoprenoid-binding protein YceI
MKYIISIIIIAAVGFGIWKVVATKAPEGIPQVTVTETSATTATSATATSTTTTTGNVIVKSASFSFTGYGPGKEHTGTFGKVSYNLGLDAKGLISSGSVVVDAATATTGIEKLDGHLASADFFDVAKYPLITFKLSNINWAPNGTSASVSSTTATGILDFHGVQKTVSFPIWYDAKTKTYSADLRIKASDFKLKYTAIKDEVRIKFSVSI